MLSTDVMQSEPDLSCVCNNSRNKYRDYNKYIKGSKFTIALFLIFFSMQFWHHEFLVWDPDECDGVTRISLPVKQLWSPDIIVYEL